DSTTATSSELSAELKEALSHRTEVIEDNSQLQAQEGANPIIDSKITRDIKTINNANDQSISESLEEIKSKVDQVHLGPHQDKLVVVPSIVTEFVQGLLEELLSDNNPLQTIKFSSPKNIVPESLSIKKLANSFCQANFVRNKTIIAKRSEITLWCLFSEKFEDKVVELRSEDKKLVDKTARSQIYAEMRPYLTGVSDGYLRVRTCKARKINKLFSYEYDPVTLKKIDGIQGYMVQQITSTSPVNKISETVATTSANDPSDDNFSDTSDITDYFKEEGVNDLIEEDSKNHNYDNPNTRSAFGFSLTTKSLKTSSPLCTPFRAYRPSFF
ncbi:17133_t:CDS:2, partial [Funneliformis geosporum]